MAEILPAAVGEIAGVWPDDVNGTLVDFLLNAVIRGIPDIAGHTGKLITIVAVGGGAVQALFHKRRDVVLGLKIFDSAHGIVLAPHILHLHSPVLGHGGLPLFVIRLDDLQRIHVGHAHQRAVPPEEVAGLPEGFDPIPGSDHAAEHPQAAVLVQHRHIGNVIGG